MAISIVGVAESSAPDGANVTITLPAMKQGDYVLVSGGVPRTSADAGVSTAGYTELSDVSVSTIFRNSVSRKIMGAVPDTSVTCLGSGNSADAASYVATVFRGVDQTTPEDATTTSATNTGSGTPDSPSITTVTAGAVVVSCGGTRTEDASVTAPTGYTNQVDITQNDSDSATAAMASKVVAVAGAENPAAWTDWTSGSWVAQTVALRPGGSPHMFMVF